MPVEIKGIQKTSLVDYPGKVCSTLFLGQCNFRCPFCHNADLVLKPQSIESISEQELLSLLDERKKWIDAVCITGGEPTFYSELPLLIKKIRAIGLLIKLDTNGTNPQLLSQLIEESLLDYIAMDIKSAKQNYSLATNSSIDLNQIQKSITLIRESNLPYEFRTTAVPGFFSEEDAKEIAEWLKGAEKFALQQFTPSENMINPVLKTLQPFKKSELESFAEIMRPSFTAFEIRT